MQKVLHPWLLDTRLPTQWLSLWTQNCPRRQLRLSEFHSFQLHKWKDCVSCPLFRGTCRLAVDIFTRWLRTEARCVCWLPLDSFYLFLLAFLSTQSSLLSLALCNSCRLQILPLLQCFVSLTLQCKLNRRNPKKLPVRTGTLLCFRIRALISWLFSNQMQTCMFFLHF